MEDFSSSEEVAGLLLAVAEQGRLEIARQARPAQKPKALAVVSCPACTCLGCSVSAQCYPDDQSAVILSQCCLLSWDFAYACGASQCCAALANL